MTTEKSLRVLVLGGTAEGYQLADALAAEPALDAITSLAGRTSSARRPRGTLRTGGFGGVAGLAEYLRRENIGAVIDATHPFSAQMGTHAALATAQTGAPLLRLERPAWTAVDGDRWTPVGDWSEAVAVLRKTAQRVLLAVGRQELAPFAGLDEIWFLIRSVEPPQPMPAFDRAELLLARGPFDRDSERALLAENRIDTIVCKNSGGAATEGKLIAARDLGLHVVMRQRPRRPDVPSASSVAQAVAWVRALRP